MLIKIRSTIYLSYPVHCGYLTGASVTTVQAYFMLDEMLLAGELQEPSKKAVTRVIEAQDQLVENAKAGGPATAVAGLSGIAIDRSRAYS